MPKATKQIAQCSAYYTVLPSPLMASQRPCFLPPAILSPHYSKPLSLCPSQAPPSHPRPSLSLASWPPTHPIAVQKLLWLWVAMGRV